MSNFIKSILIITGSLSVGIGILGIFLPILPTTPFLLLGAACYIKSSKRLYNWLINNKWLGNYIKNYREGKGLPLKVKVLSITLLWVTIGYSAAVVVSQILIKVILLLIAVGVTLHILSLKTLKKENEVEVEVEN